MPLETEVMICKPCLPVKGMLSKWICVVQQEHLHINRNLLHNKDIQMHRCPTSESWLNHQLNGRRPRGLQTTLGLQSARVSLQTAYLLHLRVGSTQNPRFERED